MSSFFHEHVHEWNHDSNRDSDRDYSRITLSLAHNLVNITGPRLWCIGNIAHIFVTLEILQWAPLVWQTWWTLQFTVWVSCLRDVKYQASCCVGEIGARSQAIIASLHGSIPGTVSMACNDFFAPHRNCTRYGAKKTLHHLWYSFYAVQRNLCTA